MDKLKNKTSNSFQKAQFQKKSHLEQRNISKKNTILYETSLNKSRFWPDRQKKYTNTNGKETKFEKYRKKGQIFSIIFNSRLLGEIGI